MCQLVVIAILLTGIPLAWSCRSLPWAWKSDQLWSGGGHLAILILVIKIILGIILRSGYYSGCRNPNNFFGVRVTCLIILKTVVTEIFSVWP